MESLVGALSIGSDLPKLQELREALISAVGAVSIDATAIVDSAIRDIDVRRSFNEWILGQLSENPDGFFKSKLVDASIERFKEFSLGHKAVVWVDLLADENKIQLIKKSNRWWVQKN